jgi:hypothetical protein
VNTFEDLEHALLTGVVLGTLRSRGIEADSILNNAEDTTPYLRLTFDGGIQALIVVMPPE